MPVQRVARTVARVRVFGAFPAVVWPRGTPSAGYWLNLAPPGSNTSTRCTESLCVKVLVYDELWAQFKIHDADGSGAPAPHHTLKWLHTNSAVETWLRNGA